MQLIFGGRAATVITKKEKPAQQTTNTLHWASSNVQHTTYGLLINDFVFQLQSIGIGHPHLKTHTNYEDKKKT